MENIKKTYFNSYFVYILVFSLLSVRESIPACLYLFALLWLEANFTSFRVITSVIIDDSVPRLSTYVKSHFPSYYLYFAGCILYCSLHTSAILYLTGFFPVICNASISKLHFLFISWFWITCSCYCVPYLYKN